MGSLTKKCAVCNGTGEILLPIGDRIKSLRDELGLTQDAFAKSLGMSRTALVNIEAGRQDVPSPHLVAIAKVHGVSVDWLLGLSARTSLAAIKSDGEGSV